MAFNINDYFNNDEVLFALLLCHVLNAVQLSGTEPGIFQINLSQYF